MLYINQKKNRVLAVLIYLIYGLGDGYAATLQEEAKQNQMKDSLKKGVVKVIAVKRKNVVERGAGIMLGEQKGTIYILTAYHIVKDALHIFIESYGVPREKVEAKIFERYDPENDITVLMVENNQFLTNSLEQMYEIDPSKFQPGDKAIIIGHPGDEEWELIGVNVHSKSSTRLMLDQGILRDSQSGGPLLDLYGNLLGIIIESTKTRYGEVVRIDTALATLDKWGVPYRVKLRVDFCSVIHRLIKSSLNNFNDIKGVKSVASGIFERGDIYWELRDRALDMTGNGLSILHKDKIDHDSNTPVYFASFGRQRNETEGKRVWLKVAEEIAQCMPGEEKYPEKFSNSPYCYTVFYSESWHTSFSSNHFEAYIHMSNNWDVGVYIGRTPGYIGNHRYRKLCINPEPVGEYWLREYEHSQLSE